MAFRLPEQDSWSNCELGLALARCMHTVLAPYRRLQDWLILSRSTTTPARNPRQPSAVAYSIGCLDTPSPHQTIPFRLVSHCLYTQIYNKRLTTSQSRPTHRDPPAAIHD